MTRREGFLAGVAGFLVLNSAYLASRADASIFYYGNVLAHVGAGVALVASSAGALRSIGLLWLSALLSAAAIIAAVAAVILPRRP